MIHHLRESNQYQSPSSAIWPRTTNTVCIHVLWPTVESLAYITCSIPENTLMQRTMTIHFDWKMCHSWHHPKQSMPSPSLEKKSMLQQNAVWISLTRRMGKKEKQSHMETTMNCSSPLQKLFNGKLNTSADIMPQRTPLFIQCIHQEEYKLLLHITSPPLCDEAAKL